MTAAEQVVATLDLATKVRLLSGRGFWVLEPVPEADLAGIVVSDGPHGLRCQAGSGDHLGLAPAAPCPECALGPPPSPLPTAPPVSPPEPP